MTSISSLATRAATKCENEWISINFGHREKQKRWWSLLPIPMPYTQFHSREARARDAAEISKWVDSYEIGMGGVFDHAGYEYISETRNTFLSAWPTTPNPKNLSSCTKVEIFCRVACCARAWPQVRTKLTSDFRMINFLRFPIFIEFYGFLNFCRGACTRRVRDIKLISTFAISMIDNHSSQIWPKSAYFLILTRRVRASRAKMIFFADTNLFCVGQHSINWKNFTKITFIIKKPRCIHNMSEV